MLVNVCRKQMTDIFAQFKPMEPKEPVSQSTPSALSFLSDAREKVGFYLSLDILSSDTLDINIK